MMDGMRVIESAYLVEDGWAWQPLGRSGWKGKRRVQVPYRGAVRLNASTFVMHPGHRQGTARVRQEPAMSDTHTRRGAMYLHI
jgi:hypothetical protein